LTWSSGAKLVPDPVTGSGDVVFFEPFKKPNGDYDIHTAGLLSHTFGTEPLLGTVSLDLNFVGSGWMGERLTAENTVFRFDPRQGSGYVMEAGQQQVLYALDNYPLDLAGWHTYSVSLNGMVASMYVDGMLVGTTPYNAGFNGIADSVWGLVYARNFEYTPAIVPEPSTFMLFGSGLIGMVGYFIRKVRAG
jgi:hypothetical protein